MRLRPDQKAQLLKMAENNNQTISEVIRSNLVNIEPVLFDELIRLSKKCGLPVTGLTGENTYGS